MTFPRLAAILLLLAASLAAAPYVSFDASPASNGSEPFSREISFEIELPDGSMQLQPAFYAGDGVWSVRLFPRQSGVYRLRNAFEGGLALPIVPGSMPAVEASAREDVFVRIDPANPLRFVRGNMPYLPFGANLPWAQGPVVPFYRKALDAFAVENLNWARIWMAHWAAMNLDWSPDNAGPSPTPGTLDLHVAASWDEIVAAAEKAGVAFQLVLQHHGQVSLTVNPNWNENPWNASNPGGFLHTPEDFFTDARARSLTKRKYRYIVARWGYSPAIMAWELFNEVHNSASLRKSPPATADVAAWHSEMAAYLRSIDPERHLVTTSLDPISSPVYADMDYLQPHLYAANMLAASRRVLLDTLPMTRPVFFGEIGDDQLSVSQEDRQTGETLIGPVWASLMGDAEQPGQTWYVERLLDSGRLHQLGSVARFIATAELARRPALKPFEPRVVTEQTMPFRLQPALWWHRHEPSVVDVPVDGREPAEAALIPRPLVGSPASIADGFPDRASLRLHLPAATRAVFKLGGANVGGATAQLLVNGATVSSHDWPAEKATRALAEPATLTAKLPQGEVIVTLRNSGGREWFHFDEMQLDLPMPVIGALGRRTDSLVLLWAWNKLPSTERGGGVPATLIIDQVSAGTWRVRFWDTSLGTVMHTQEIRHLGGDLAVQTPPVRRHLAVILERFD
ncbi:MAG: cellulase family glycosylhydrolase [Opitutaceae bacterium]|nr:cellulase family glycosylhydrolase [Opitutaceae bacterium]